MKRHHHPRTKREPVAERLQKLNAMYVGIDRETAIQLLTSPAEFIQHVHKIRSLNKEITIYKIIDDLLDKVGVEVETLKRIIEGNIARPKNREHYHYANIAEQAAARLPQEELPYIQSFLENPEASRLHGIAIHKTSDKERLRAFVESRRRNKSPFGDMDGAYALVKMNDADYAVDVINDPYANWELRKSGVNVLCRLAKFSDINFRRLSSLTQLIDSPDSERAWNFRPEGELEFSNEIIPDSGRFNYVLGSQAENTVRRLIREAMTKKDT